MRGFPKLCVRALVLLLTITGLPALSQAQGVAGSTDFRGRVGYSAEDMALALFPPETASAPSVQTRGIGSPQVRPSMPSMPIPRPAVTLNVLFGSNSDIIPPTSYAEIDKLGTLLSWPQYNDYRVQLEGHTDSQGSARKNQALSEKRVQNIKAYLIQHFHLAPERIQAVGYGSSRPLASNDTPDGRSQNRRVEVVNLGRAQ
jgi:outer membrane protein OmpA-like peptidoglycan-associated protein